MGVHIGGMSSFLVDIHSSVDSYLILRVYKWETLEVLPELLVLGQELYMTMVCFTTDCMELKH